MAKTKKRRVATPMQPGVIIGRDPDTGVIHRLTIEGTSITIERQPYKSPNADGWVKHYQKLTSLTELHEHLIDKISKNPAVWPC